MSPHRHSRSSPKWSAQSDIDEKGLLGTASFPPRQPSGLLSKTSDLFFAILPIWACGRRRKSTKQSQTQHNSKPKMCLLIRADDGYRFQEVDLAAVSHDTTAGAMVISEELAGRLLPRKDLWRRISPRPIVDDLGLKHHCEHSFQVSYRWETDKGTRDAKVYVSSKLNQQDRLNERGSLAKVDLLVPRGSGPVEARSTPTVAPNYLLPLQTQEEKDRQARRVADANKAQDEARKAAQQKKAKKFEDASKKPDQGAR